MSNRIVSGHLIAVLISLVISIMTLIGSLLYMNHLQNQVNQAGEETAAQDVKRTQVFREKFSAVHKELGETKSNFSAYQQQAQGEIRQLKTDVATTQTTLTSTKQKLDETSARLKTVVSQRDELTTTLEKLQKDIANYNTQITEFRAKLQTETKEKEFMLVQVKDLEAKRDALQKKWNDLAALQNQVRTLVTVEHVRQRERLADRRGFWGIYQNSGLRNFKTYAEVQTEKTSGTTTIEVYRSGSNPPPKESNPQNQSPQPAR